MRPSRSSAEVVGPVPLIQAAQAPVVAGDPDPRRLVETIRAALDVGRPVAVLDGGWPAARRAQARAELAEHAADLRPGDLVVFTSGTSGRPRAVRRELASWLASAGALTDLLGLCADDVTWLPGHPAATLSLYAAWHALGVGSRVRYAGERHADATVVHAVPSLVPGILRARAGGDLPRLRLLVTAGDRVPPDLRARCADLRVRLLAYYGAAELSFVALRDDLSYDNGDGAGRHGYRAFPGVELDIRDGLLWSRSGYQALGYLGQRQDCGVAGGEHGPLRRTNDGWACVGDYARWVAPGRVEILGRADEAVTVAGHTVLVEDLEATLRDGPGIDDALVVGLPDPVHGARLGALWIHSGPSDVRAPAFGEVPAGLSALVAPLPTYARPRSWVRMPAVPGLPRTSAGKPDRPAARALAADTGVQGP